MNLTDSVAVTSRSFSRNRVLREELLLKYKKVKFNDSGLALSGEKLIEFLSGFDKAITALEIIDSTILSSLPELKVISKYGVGIDMINTDDLKKFNVRLGWTGGVNSRSVSELVISCAISLLRHVPIATEEVNNLEWRQHIGRQLSNSVVGIVGCGNIGKDLAKLLKPFGAEILAHDLLDFSDFYSKNNIKSVNLETLLKCSDIVTLHLPLDSSTKNILDKEHLNMMKSSSILINHARGGLLDESELLKMLIEGKIAGAALDVLNKEPPKTDRLINLKNTIVTPHIGGSSIDAIMAMGRAAIDGLD